MALGDNCRHGCRSRNHASWGACVRDAGLRVGWMESTSGLSRVADTRLQGELAEYRNLRSQGVQPAGTTRHHLEEAKRISDHTGSAYNAETMSPTTLLTDKRVIKAATEAGQL